MHVWLWVDTYCTICRFNSPADEESGDSDTEGGKESTQVCIGLGIFSKQCSSSYACWRAVYMYCSKGVLLAEGREFL